MKSLPYCTAAVNEIASLADKPNAAGMTAAQLKAKFDASGAAIKEYINETLAPYINETLAPYINETLAVPIEAATENIAALQKTEHTHSNKTALDSYNKSMSELLLAIYPIGSIYTSTVSTSPASLFGGTWERIKDVFLLAAGDSYEAGATGGSADAVTVAHWHYLFGYDLGSQTGSPPNWGEKVYVTGWSSHGQYSDYTIVSSPIQSYGAGNGISSTVGEDGTGKNMPPYLSVYCWKRIA